MNKSAVTTIALGMLAAVAGFWVIQQVRADERAKYRRDVTYVACMATVEITGANVDGDDCSKAANRVGSNH